jgi:hypothetical protein
MRPAVLSSDTRREVRGTRMIVELVERHGARTLCPVRREASDSGSGAVALGIKRVELNRRRYGGLYRLGACLSHTIVGWGFTPPLVPDVTWWGETPPYRTVTPDGTNVSPHRGRVTPNRTNVSPHRTRVTRERRFGTIAECRGVWPSDSCPALESHVLHYVIALSGGSAAAVWLTLQSPNLPLFIRRYVAGRIIPPRNARPAPTAQPEITRSAANALVGLRIAPIP